ncbi:30S ribosomal protein S7 [bacterium DOLZORAL124_38_8]|nr:MAG: 30S ribosomal protein S7 [bacterium DOLZORAL124_38_8]
MAKETKVAAAEVASKNSAGAEKKAPKAKKFVNPFSLDDPLQSKFVNGIMKGGKKELARRILKDCFEEMHRRGADDVLKTFEKAIKNVTPSMEVRPKRIGGSVYQIPIEVTTKRQLSLPIRWILAGARAKKGQPMFKRLASELMDAATEQGSAFGKKTEAQRAAQANKAFAHLARY